MRTLTLLSDEPLADGLLASLGDEVLKLQSVSIEGGTFTFKCCRAPAESKVATDPATPETVIHHKHENIAASVSHRDDLLVDEHPSGPMPAYGKALGELMEDPSTKDVARLLIAPLLERGLKIKGNPSEVLKRVANTFKKLSASKLSFAAQYLLKGKHELFPDNEEIYAAIGRYEPTSRPSASDPNAHVNGAHA
jgi:hypothetical protein